MHAKTAHNPSNIAQSVVSIRTSLTVVWTTNKSNRNQFKKFSFYLKQHSVSPVIHPLHHFHLVATIGYCPWKHTCMVALKGQMHQHIENAAKAHNTKRTLNKTQQKWKIHNKNSEKKIAKKHNGSVFKGTKNVSCGNDKLIVNNK